MDPLKYAVVERERRWLLAAVPPGGGEVVLIEDRYVRGTRLRLRHVTSADGTVVRKLGHKVRLGDGGPAEVACTSLYLDDAEWELLAVLPSDRLAKRRTRRAHAGAVICMDEFLGDLAGLVLGEIDRRDGPQVEPPGEWRVVREVTTQEAFTGAELAGRGVPPGMA